MKEKNNKVEVLFKTYLSIPDPTKEGVKFFLEQTIEGLKVKLTEIVPGKTRIKALVTSNLLSLLTGQISFEDAAENSDRAKSFFVARNTPRNNQGALESKAKKVHELESLVSKLRKEISDAKSKELDTKSMFETFQEQLNNTSVKIEQLDIEKERLEEENNSLKEEVEKLTARLENREKTKAKISGIVADSDLSKELEALEELLEQRTKEYEDDKRTLQDQLGLMSLKILAERDRADDFIKKAEMTETLQFAIAPLEAENKSLREELDAKQEEFAAKEKAIKESEEVLEKLKKENKDHSKKISKLESLIRKSEAKAATATEKLKKEEQAKEELSKKLSELEEENKNLSASLQKELATIKKLTDNIDNKGLNEHIEKLKIELKEAVNQNAILKKELEETHEESKKQLSIMEAKANIKEKPQNNIMEKDKDSKISDTKIEDSRTEDIKTNGVKVEDAKEEDTKVENNMTKGVKAEDAKVENKEHEELKTEDTKSNEENTKAMEVKEEPSDKPIIENEEGLIRLKNELSKIEEELAKTKREYNIIQKELESTKEELECERTLREQENRMQQAIRTELEKTLIKVTDNNTKDVVDEDIEDLREELEQATKMIAALEIKNKYLEQIADTYSSNPGAIQFSQKQDELSVKENTELKESLSAAESDKNNEIKEVKVVEEVKKIIGEVVYAYKTMSTNAKGFEKAFVEKKEQVEYLISALEDLGSLKKASEIAIILKRLEDDMPFLKGFPKECDQYGIMIDCLTKVAEKKQKRLELYDNEIRKYNIMIEVADSKVTEYEKKLEFY